MKKALFIANNYWTTPFQVGTHELAKQFLKHGWHTAFISDPISPFHVMLSNSEDIKARKEIWKAKGKFFDENLFTYIPFTLTPPTQSPFVNFDFFIQNWDKFCIPSIDSILSQNGFDKVDFLYIDSVYQGCLLNKIKYDHSLFRMADKNAGFAKISEERIIKLEKNICSHVDAVAYPSAQLTDYIESLNPKNYFILKNGVDYKHFAREDILIPEEFNNIPSPRVLYVGAIDFWFDFDLINRAAKEFPDVSFVLIGNDRLAKEKLHKLKNIYVLGTRKYETIPSYMQYSQIGIIPFNKKDYADLVNSINPLKLYQYSAAGIPTISVEWEHLKEDNSVAHLYNNYEEFKKLLTKLLESEINKESLREYAKQFDWENQYYTIVNKLGLPSEK